MCNSTIKSWKIRQKVLDVWSCSVCATKFSFQIVSFIYWPVAAWICIWMSSWLHYPTYSKDPAMPANYLGIALASCLSKLLELCNLMLFQMCSALPTCILGLLYWSLYWIIEGWCIHQGSKVQFDLLDMSKAFDLVDHGLLFELLLKQNLPCPVICFLLQWYSSQSLHCFSHFVCFFMWLNWHVLNFIHYRWRFV